MKKLSIVIFFIALFPLLAGSVFAQPDYIPLPEFAPGLDDVLENDSKCVWEQINFRNQKYWSGGIYRGQAPGYYYSESQPIRMQLRGKVTVSKIEIVVYGSGTKPGTTTLTYQDGQYPVIIPQLASGQSLIIEVNLPNAVTTDWFALQPNTVNGVTFMAIQRLSVFECIEEPDLSSEDCVWQEFLGNHPGWTGGEVQGIYRVQDGYGPSAPDPLRLTFSAEQTFDIMELTWRGNPQVVTRFNFDQDEKRLWLSNSTGDPVGGVYQLGFREYKFAPQVSTTYIEFPVTDDIVLGRFYLEIRKVRLCVGNIKLQRPFTEPDTHAYDYWTTEDYAGDEYPPSIPNLNFMVSNEAFDPVYNMVDGEVVEVQELSGLECGGYTGSIIPVLEDCNFFTPMSIITQKYRVSAEFYGPGTSLYYPIFRVRVVTGVYTVTYVLTNPKSKEGDVISQNCRLGDSLILDPVQPSQPTSPVPRGLVIVGVRSLSSPASNEETYDPVEFEGHPTPTDDCNVKATVQRPLAEEDEALAPFDGFEPLDYDISNFCKAITDVGFNTCDTDGVFFNRVMNSSIPEVQFALSKAGLAPVYNIEAGMVLEVEEVLMEDCLYYTSGSLYSDDTNGCLFEIPDYARPQSGTVFKRLDIENHPMYRVFVLTENDNLITYLVTDPSVSAGDEIRQHCIIGRTIPIREPLNLQSSVSEFLQLNFQFVIDNLELIFGEGISYMENAGLTMVMMEPYLPATYINEIIPATKEHNLARIRMEGYPEPGLACNVSPDFSECLTINPKFQNNGEFWENINPARPAIWLNPRVILEPDAGIRLPAINLDPTKEYGASMNASTDISFTGQLQISIGGTVFTKDIPASQTAINIEAQQMSPTIGTLYDIVLTNTGQYDVTVQYFCLVEGEPNQYPNNCLYLNNGFDLGLLFWQSSFVHEYRIPEGLPPWDVGWVYMPVANNGTGFLRQTVRLNTNVDGTAHTYSGFIIYEATHSFSLSISGNNGLEAYYSLNPALNRLDFDLTISESDDYNTLYGFEDMGSGNSLHISKICIEGPYPGQEGGGGEPPDPGVCDVEPAFPGYTDVPKLLVWQWIQFDQYHQCQLLPRIDDLYKQSVKSYNFATEQGQFWMYTTYRGTNWLGTDVFPWFAGYMSNIAPGTIVVNNQQCTGFDLICLASGLIDLLRSSVDGFFAVIPQIIGEVIRPILDFILYVLGAAVNLLFTVLIAVIGLILDFLAELIRLSGMGVNVLVSLITAWNTAPAIPISGFPSCSSATVPDGLCLVWWLVENTLFSGVGSAIIPAIASLAWIMLGLWIVRQIKQIMQQVGSSA